MAELHVRNVSSELHERLHEQAVREGRSLSAEAVAILQRALLGDHQSARRHSAIDRLRRIQQHSHSSNSAPSAEQFVREDRDTAK